MRPLYRWGSTPLPPEITALTIKGNRGMEKREIPMRPMKK
jgi:hypothetical protein